MMGERRSESGFVWSRSGGAVKKLGRFRVSRTAGTEEDFAAAFCEVIAAAFPLNGLLIAVELQYENAEVCDALEARGWRTPTLAFAWADDSSDVATGIDLVWGHVDSLWAAAVAPPRDLNPASVWATVTQAATSIGRIDSDELRVRSDDPQVASSLAERASRIGASRGLVVLDQWGW